MVGKVRAASTRNQYLQLFKALSAWGMRKGYLSQPWFGPLSDLKREKLASYLHGHSGVSRASSRHLGGKRRLIGERL